MNFTTLKCSSYAFMEKCRQNLLLSTYSFDDAIHALRKRNRQYVLTL